MSINRIYGYNTTRKYNVEKIYTGYHLKKSCDISILKYTRIFEATQAK